MTEPRVLAIDQGTSSTKCLLIGPQGRVLARGSAPVGIGYPEPGWVEQSPQDIWASVGVAVAQCLQGRDASRVAALGLSTQRESVLLWERATSRPVSPVLGWQDRRTVDTCRQLRSELGELVRQRTGLPLDPMFSAPKARWLLDRFDPTRVRSARGELCLGTVDSWLTYQLLGRHEIEVGNASRTQLLDLRTGAWSEELLAAFGVPWEVLPEVVPSAGMRGPVTGPGPLAGVPLTSVLADSHAALFAHGVRRPGPVKATYGTGSSVMGLLDPERLPALQGTDALCVTIAWHAGQLAYAVEGNILASGATLVWLAELLRVSVRDVLEMAAGSGSAGVQLVPAFRGLGAPWWDDAASGTLTGLTLGTGPEHLARAAVESVALQVSDVVGAIAGAVAPVDRLLADGGLSTSDLLMQLQADVTGVPVERAREGDLSALGTAHLAGLEVGVWTEQELATPAHDRDVFTPARQGAGASADLASAWRTALGRARYRAPS